MDFLKLDKKIKNIWYFSTTILFIVCLGICVVTQLIEGIILPLLIIEIIIISINKISSKFLFPALILVIFMLSNKKR